MRVHACVPQGPREDSGARSTVDPGVRLVKQLYSYAKAYHPKTRIMASGIRTRDGEAHTLYHTAPNEAPMRARSTRPMTVNAVLINAAPCTAMK